MNTIRFRYLFPVSALSIIALPALATPYVSPKCQPPSVASPENGSGVLFDEDCTTAYVLPPIVGKAELAALAQNANLQFCPAQLKVGVVATSTLDSAKIISDQLVAMVKGYKPGADELEKLRANPDIS